MSKENLKNAIQLTLMIAITMLSQIIALYKSSFTATNFGASNEMDAYNFSTSMATFLFLFITSGITTVIIPAYVKNESREVIDTFLTVVYSIVLSFFVFIFFFKTPLISMINNRDMEFKNSLSNTLLIVFGIQGILSFQGVTTAYYQTRNYYLTPKITMLSVNLFVALMLIFVDIQNVSNYLLVLLLGSIINIILDVFIAIKVGFRYRPRWNLRNKEVKNLFSIFLPTLFSSGIYKIQTFIDSLIAMNLALGMLTILSYSSQVIVMVNNLLIGNLTVYVYPKIVRKIHEKKNKVFFWDYSILFHSIICLVIAVYFVSGKDFLVLIFQGGKFGHRETQILFICVAISIFGQQFNIIRDLVYRYFYANGDTRITLNNSVIVSIVNVLLSLTLSSMFGLYGILIGTALSSLISLSMILIRFEKKYGIGVPLKSIFKELFKNEVSLLISVFLSVTLKKLIPSMNIFLEILIYSAFCLIFFLAILKLFRSRVFKTEL